MWVINLNIRLEENEEEESGEADDSKMSVYKSLCKDGSNLTESYKKELICRYSRSKDPYFILRPIKEEIVHLDPKVVVFHDVVHDGEIRALKSLAEDEMNVSQTVGGRNFDGNIWSIRDSKVAWLAHNATSLTEKIINRVSGITGLDADFAEPLQMANYGLGGHYIPHFDHFTAEPSGKNHPSVDVAGDRIATWLFYFSDVTFGGGTVFPNLKVAVAPRKGSALFWHNLYRNGSGIRDTLHAACPVLVGNKWAANLWIREFGQALHRPCTLTQLE